MKKVKNRYIAIIYGGLAKNETIKAIHTKLLNETLNFKKKEIFVSNTMLKVANQTTNLLKNKTYNTNTAVLPLLAFNLIKKKKVEETLSKVITEETNKLEGEEKEETLNNTVENNRYLDDPKIFYLASSHNDCAKDHLKYQGKIYFDRNWEDASMPDSLKNAVRNYIRTHNTRSFQWVTGKPVYFITRPNCRHFFAPLTISETLGSSVKSLIEKHNTHHEVGRRDYMQTMGHDKVSTKQEAINNAQVMIDKYKERLDMLLEMKKEQNLDLIDKGINKTKLLIQKWENYIRKLTK